MPLFVSHTIPLELRKSKRTESTDFLFDINSKRIKLLNVQNIQTNYNVEIVKYFDFSKVDLIKELSKITKKNIVDIKEMLKTTPINVVENVSKKEAEKIKKLLAKTSSIIRIY